VITPYNPDVFYKLDIIVYYTKRNLFVCGLAGYIGESKKPEITYQLITRLFEKAELRGRCAAGFWGTQKNDGILYHKEPIRATSLVKKDIWKKIAEINPNLLLVHAREASVGSGLPAINKNNHPFINKDGTIALVHNGKIGNPEQYALRKKYETISECDSEILLRIFENGNEETEFLEENRDLTGLRDIWSYLSRSHGQTPPAMAVAIAEKLPNTVRRLWLFRNNLRTLWAIDLREALGQIFFCSTEEMWHYGLATCPDVQTVLNDFTIKLVELPPEEVWLMEISSNDPVVNDENFQKFVVSPCGDFEPWTYTGELLKTKRKFCDEMITTLDENDEIAQEDQLELGLWD
jgi:predicted glutamine amidotransferase